MIIQSTFRRVNRLSSTSRRLYKIVPSTFRPLQSSSGANIVCPLYSNDDPFDVWPLQPTQGGGICWTFYSTIRPFNHRPLQPPSGGRPANRSILIHRDDYIITHPTIGCFNRHQVDASADCATSTGRVAYSTIQLTINGGYIA